MLKKLAAAVIAASTAIIPFSADNVNVFSPTNVYAEEKGAAVSLPEWVPTDPESALEFRNTYGAVHIQNGLICIVYPNRAEKGKSSDTYGYELRTDGNSRQILKHDIYLSDNTETCFEVFVYQPQVQGDLTLKLVDPHVQVKPSEKETGDNWEPPTVAEYTFTVDKELNITETDIYSWLPDCEKEYWDYAEKNSHLSVKDNYVVFCLSHNAGTAYDWTQKDKGTECFKLETTSSCTPLTSVPLDGGQVNTIYVYKAVKDGYDKISYYFGEVFSDDYEDKKPLVADCAVINGGQNILLSGDMRVTLADYDTGELLTLEDGAMPTIWTDISQSTPDGEVFLNMQPSGFKQNPAVVRLGSFFEGYNFSFGLSSSDLPLGYSLPDTEDGKAGFHNGTIVPEDYMTVKKYDNGTADVVFRLKKNSNSKKSTKITFYDADTGELTDIPEDNTYLLKCTSGTPSTSEIFDISSNPCTLKSAYVYEKSCSYSFHTDSRSGGYDSLTFEVISESSNSVELACRMKWNPSGDANGDGSVSVADIVTMQKWLLGSASVKLSDLKAVDFCRDNKLDIFDLVLMRKALLRSINLPVEVSIQESGGVVGAMLIYKVYSEGENYFLSYQDLTYDQEPKSKSIQISEQEYREIMSEAYNNYLEVETAPPRPSEIDFKVTLNNADGSQKQASSDRFPSVLTKLREMLDKGNNSSYVEPDELFEFGTPFFVKENSLKLYSGPDESYEVLATIPADTRLIEKGTQDNNNDWLFTEYNGQYGWIKVFTDDGKTSTIYFELVAKKPVIYLYPEEETDVHVELELTEADLSTTYPRYNNGWNVTASPDGSLLNKADGTHHKYLFWDAVNCRTRFDFTQGFCVAGKDTESFLKEKLTYMGLTEEEMNEFIVYWLPLMEHNAYNLISFQGDVYTDSAKLNITPNPDSLLRVFMAYVPLEEAVDIQPQQLETFERKGFTVVEWGGSEIKAQSISKS
ncbi:dockerin type I domain-containing protein [Ruminococcus flavefaciens]|uniref:dockerin type I domain-containing protein n=1 Tax=Ruminococcus flavefaciens TaxID=1265 RepID=UPI000465B0F3|nr:dockerin type I domain-containing protein [Ruminococcus flavefaciens]